MEKRKVHTLVCVCVCVCMQGGWWTNQEQTFISLFPVLSGGDI